MPLTSPQPGEDAGGGATRQAKPQAFVDFEHWANADPSRLDALIQGIGGDGANEGADLGSDANFWHNSPISKADTDHFLADWIGGGYWDGDDNRGETLYARLRAGVRQGAELAKERLADEPATKLRMELAMNAGANEVSAEPVLRGNDVVIQITTPRI